MVVAVCGGGVWGWWWNEEASVEGDTAGQTVVRRAETRAVRGRYNDAMAVRMMEPGWHEGSARVVRGRYGGVVQGLCPGGTGAV